MHIIHARRNVVTVSCMDQFVTGVCPGWRSARLCFCACLLLVYCCPMLYCHCRPSTPMILPSLCPRLGAVCCVATLKEPFTRSDKRMTPATHARPAPFAASECLGEPLTCSDKSRSVWNMHVDMWACCAVARRPRPADVCMSEHWSLSQCMATKWYAAPESVLQTGPGRLRGCILRRFMPCDSCYFA